MLFSSSLPCVILLPNSLFPLQPGGGSRIFCGCESTRDELNDYLGVISAPNQESAQRWASALDVTGFTALGLDFDEWVRI
jgi:hypothetical protein